MLAIATWAVKVAGPAPQLKVAPVVVGAGHCENAVITQVNNNVTVYNNSLTVFMIVSFYKLEYL
jgi:hypothetical protein